MKQYRITLEGHVFDVKLLDDPRQAKVRVEVNGEAFTVEVEAVSSVAESNTAPLAPRSPREPAPIPAGGTASGGTLTAPLPGVIKSIAVRSGQHVASNDELLTIEAMKMDNVIRAAFPGTVGTIHVNEGRQVAYGEPLLDLSEG